MFGTSQLPLLCSMCVVICPSISKGRLVLGYSWGYKNLKMLKSLLHNVVIYTYNLHMSFGVTFGSAKAYMLNVCPSLVAVLGGGGTLNRGSLWREVRYVSFLATETPCPIPSV